jgi:putative acetyltransferase
MSIQFSTMHQITIRTIQPSDNSILSNIIRSTLTEFKANHAGTVFTDPSTDHLYELFQAEKSRYYVAVLNGRVIGGGGIYPSKGLPHDTCELVKMYLLPEARGLGLGKMLIEKALSFAKESGFRFVYIETMPELKKAVKVYEKFGFSYLDAPLGETGHFGCNIWMKKELD